MKKLFLSLALASVITGVMAAPTTDSFDPKLYESCSDRSRVAVSFAMLTRKGQAAASSVALYKGSPLDQRLETMAAKALDSDFREGDSGSMVVLQNFLAGVCYQSVRSKT